MIDCGMYEGGQLNALRSVVVPDPIGSEIFSGSGSEINLK
jgi:hypothetical protein